MAKPDVSIILVSYNTKEHTIKAIQSVIDETHHTNYEIIVVDNQSSDGSLEEIQNVFSDISTYDSGANLGFAGGVHFGVKRSTGDYILLLNPDTIVLDGAIDKLFLFAKKRESNGIWGGVTLNNDLSINTQHAWARHDFLSLLFSALGLSKAFNKSCFFNKANYGCWNRDSIKEVDIISGCFFLTTRTLWGKLGGLDPTFFMYAEEADYCLKAAKLGYKPIVNNESRIIHHGGISHANLAAKQIKLLKGKVELFNRHDSVLVSYIYKKLLILYVYNKYLLSKFGQGKIELKAQWKKVLMNKKDWIKGYAN